MANQDTPADQPADAQPTRIRLIIDTEELFREAVRQRARKLSVQYRREVSNSEVVNELIRTGLAEEIAELSDEPPKRRKGK